MLWSTLAASMFGVAIAEYTGAIPATTTANADGTLVIRGLAMTPGGLPPLAIGALAFVAVVTVAVVFTHVHRVTEQKLRLAFHLQAWQVRQLVPEA